MQNKTDEELFFEAIDQYKDSTDKELILASMKAIFTNMPDLDVTIGEKND